MRYLILIHGLFSVSLLSAANTGSSPQTTPDDPRFEALEERIANLENKLTFAEQTVRSTENQLAAQQTELENLTVYSFVMLTIPFGSFAAVWAQNTARNPWLWFFYGFFGGPVTMAVLVVKNRRIHRSECYDPMSGIYRNPDPTGSIPLTKRKNENPIALEQ